ncbi:MAG: NAD(P)-dependent oxidoreductase [Gemmataceae bacterium]
MSQRPPGRRHGSPRRSGRREAGSRRDRRHPHPATNDEDVVLDRGRDADVLLVYHDIRLSERVIAGLPRCRGIIRLRRRLRQRRSAGRRRGVVVCNVPDYGTEEVADHALMTLLAIARRLIPAHLAIRNGGWDLPVGVRHVRLRGRTLGIVGCGRIGTAMALRGSAGHARGVLRPVPARRGRQRAGGRTSLHAGGTAAAVGVPGACTAR